MLLELQVRHEYDLLPLLHGKKFQNHIKGKTNKNGLYLTISGLFVQQICHFGDFDAVFLPGKMVKTSKNCVKWVVQYVLLVKWVVLLVKWIVQVKLDGFGNF